MLELDWQAPFAVDVRVTLGVQGRGKGDPTYRVDEAGAIWRTSLTPDGPATIRVLPSRAPPAILAATRVRAWAWGPGAEWLLGRASWGAWGFMTMFRGSIRRRTR